MALSRVRTDAGFTLVETLTAMAILTVMLALVAGGAASWTRSREHAGSADELVSFLRNAQQRALTEATTYCVTFGADNRSWSLRKYSCTDPVTRGPAETAAPAITLQGAAFTQADGSTAAQVVFLPRGSATPGSVQTVRSGSPQIYVVTVEGLTGRVSSS